MAPAHHRITIKRAMEMQINLPVGYELRRLDDGDVLVYTPGDVRDPETGEWLGRRALLRFMPEYPGIIQDVEHLAQLDAYAQTLLSTTVASPQLEIAEIFQRWRGH
jgi:hypothetical protein